MTVSQLLNKGYHLHTDNFYTKPALAEYLLEQRTLLTATVRSNSKGLPKNKLERLGAAEIYSQVLEKDFPKPAGHCHAQLLDIIQLSQGEKDGQRQVYPSNCGGNVQLPTTATAIAAD
ncbi:hypothetical protein RRG08_066185 [Elysia crispata]|uniref:PiggyBac transposable element-derived protein domain-containing protein n=1 Tax=Elysia crispata TaxID=231223 RepID=A0AAE0YLD5_9GAST|nr:hypothetical protein RRG08_066185 [Elysia crispata]